MRSDGNGRRDGRSPALVWMPCDHGGRARPWFACPFGLACAFGVMALCHGCGESARSEASYPPNSHLPQCEPQTPAPSHADTDGDGTPDDQDSDADGDGIENQQENYGGCVGPDPDGDGIDNWLDLDSDGDGLMDSEEVDAETNAYVVDTDHDGFSDFVEVIGAGTDPNNELNFPGERESVVAFDGDPIVTHKVLTDMQIEFMDIFFLLDGTLTMRAERTKLISSMEDWIIPGAAKELENSWFGAAGLADYPIGFFGHGGDEPFYLLTPMIPPDQDTHRWSTDASAEQCGSQIGSLEAGRNGTRDIVDALFGVRCDNGGDFPESYIPALWNVATGDVGFRPFALPVIMMIGDDGMHDGPADSWSYHDFGDDYPEGGRGLFIPVPDAPSFEDTVDALRAINARIVGIYSGSTEEGGTDGDGNAYQDKIAQWQALLKATGSVDADGEPLMFYIDEDGTGLELRVIDAIQGLSEGLAWDVTARPELAGGPRLPASLDRMAATDELVRSLKTKEAYSAGGDAGPGSLTYEHKDDQTFFSAQPGAKLEFEVELDLGAIPQGREARLATLEIRYVGDGQFTLSVGKVYLLIPPLGGEIRM